MEKDPYTILPFGGVDVGKRSGLELIADVLNGGDIDYYDIEVLEPTNEQGGSSDQIQTKSARIYEITSSNGIAPEDSSLPMPFTTTLPIPSCISPGDLLNPSLAPPSFSFSMSADHSPEGASSCSPFDFGGNPQVPFVDTPYDVLLKQGYPGNSLTAFERRDVLRRTIANEIAQLPSTARDIKKLANIRRVADVIPEDLPSSGKKTTTFVLQCAWVNCNHCCSRPDRLKTHVYTHIQFKPFPCDQSCGEPNWYVHSY